MLSRVALIPVTALNSVAWEERITNDGRDKPTDTQIWALLQRDGTGDSCMSGVPPMFSTPELPS